MPKKRLPLEAVDLSVALRDGRPTERVNFLVTPGEKAEILEEAKSRGLTVTEYFLRLHRRVMQVGSETRPGNRRG